VLLSQGAEARLYTATFLGCAAVVKERFRKDYRHPSLDAKLTHERLAWEARCLHRARRCGVDAPLLLFVDGLVHRIYMEAVRGVTVRAYLLALAEDARRAARLDSREAGAGGGEGHHSAAALLLAGEVGRCIARLHDAAGMVHGDLTSSNMMLRGCSEESAAAPPQGGFAVVMIDFGLSHFATSPEERAVDLYVLERACGSAHSDMPGLFEGILAAYLAAAREPRPVQAKLEQVRQRGRKRLAFG